MDYLEKILNARVYDVAIETPLELAPILSTRSGNRILFKREDMQPVFSFKLRGAYNKIAHLTPAQRKRGVICASAGNHAQGVALSAQKLGACGRKPKSSASRRWMPMPWTVRSRLASVCGWSRLASSPTARR
jgi:threonine dehydratase